jgi:hypothetical protein
MKIRCHNRRRSTNSSSNSASSHKTSELAPRVRTICHSDNGSGGRGGITGSGAASRSLSADMSATPVALPYPSGQARRNREIRRRFALALPREGGA